MHSMCQTRQNLIHRPRQAVRGLTLLEILIALFLGLVLSLGAAQLFDTNQRMFRFQQGVSEATEVGRFSINFLSSDIRRAGYRPGRSDLGAASITVQDAADVNENDILTIRYAGDVFGNVNCDGSQAVNGIVVNTYQILEETNGAIINSSESQSNRFALVCNNQQLISGVERFRVLFGIDLNNDNTADVFQPTIPTNNIERVVAVRIGLVASSDADINAETPISGNIAFLDTQIDFSNGTEFELDGRLRRIYIKTVVLRNEQSAPNSIIAP